MRQLLIDHARAQRALKRGGPDADQARAVMATPARRRQLSASWSADQLDQ